MPQRCSALLAWQQQFRGTNILVSCRRGRFLIARSGITCLPTFAAFANQRLLRNSLPVPPRSLLVPLLNTKCQQSSTSTTIPHFSLFSFILFFSRVTHTQPTRKIASGAQSRMWRMSESIRRFMSLDTILAQVTGSRA